MAPKKTSANTANTASAEPKTANFVVSTEGKHYIRVPGGFYLNGEEVKDGTLTGRPARVTDGSTLTLTSEQYKRLAEGVLKGKLSPAR